MEEFALGGQYQYVLSSGQAPDSQSLQLPEASKIEWKLSSECLANYENQGSFPSNHELGSGRVSHRSDESASNAQIGEISEGYYPYSAASFLASVSS